jgi:hypothetical protein
VKWRVNFGFLPYLKNALLSGCGQKQLVVKESCEQESLEAKTASLYGSVTTGILSNDCHCYDEGYKS